MDEKPATLFWLNAEGYFCRFVALEADRIYVATPPADNHDAIRMALEDGEETAPALGDDYKARISFDAIKKVQFNRQNDTDASIAWKNNGESKTTSLEFASHEDRELFYNALKERLGLGAEAIEVRYSRFRALLAPLCWGAGVALLTLTMGSVAILDDRGELKDENHGRASLIVSIIEWFSSLLGVTGSVIFGGICMFLVLLYARSRFKNPPILVTLKPPKG